MVFVVCVQSYKKDSPEKRSLLALSRAGMV
jgi:hypothetical protein